MSLSQQSEESGRGQQRTQTCSSLSTDDSPSAIPKISDVSIPLTTDNVQTLTASQTTPMGGRGRGAHLKPRTLVPHSHWKVSDLTIVQFKSNTQPSKPKELGKIGEAIEVMVNYFPIIKYPHSGLVYQYDIQIKTKNLFKVLREHRRVLYQCWLNEYCRTYTQINKYKIVFDNHHIIFTIDQPLLNIDENGITEKIMAPNRINHQEEYQISIKRVGNPIDLSLLRSLDEFYNTKTNSNINVNDVQIIQQILSIVLHENCSSNATYIYNRSFFAQPILENKHGHWDLGLGKALWRGFYSCLVFTNGTNRLLMNLDMSYTIFIKEQSFIDFLCEVMLHSPLGKKYYKNMQKVQKAEMEVVVEFLDQNISGTHYHGEIEFLLNNCERKYPTLPTLIMHNRAFVPMEFVDIQPIKVKRITDEQRALLCLTSSMIPSDYHQSIMEIRQNPKQQCFEQDPFIDAWNFNVDVNMLKVPARILPMPQIIYTKEFHVNNEQLRSPGVWSSTKTQFHRPTKFPPCELQFGFGIITQMIKLKEKEKEIKNQWNYSRLNNILLKINTKLDGDNSILHVPDVIGEFFSHGHRYMYVGVDLSHGAPSSGRKFSTVGVVASADDIPNRYFKEIYIQERLPEARGQSREYVVDMKQIMKSLISQYEQHHRYPPKAIVIYRDGIANSEFDSVFEKELMAIREACVELSSVYRPYLTYIVVNKKHHTRFFPTDSTGNVKAGTVNDSHDITNPTTYDFFLNSHHAEKGTSRPTHYYVLYDDNKLKPDQIRMLTYALCYTYARCTRSIAIPAPVKYADLLAFRANFYINRNDPWDTESDSSESNILLNQTVNVENMIKSKRIVLSSKLAPDCPFFL
ncbi:unnamed protein product [Rotaria sordida]|uniref:Piwi domain-containing protein n=1 Tax=Rotaria sordida TaxID=392033 RepID=A0A819IF53_9BILA|nr:unnamed protein product [Rotaria sordida]